MELILIIAGLVIIAFLGAPLFAIIGAIALLLFYGAGIDTTAVIIELYRIAETPTLIAIPLFTFAGYMLAESRSPKRLVELAQALFGSIPGGLALVVIVISAFFTAFTGASGVTIVALGGLLYPILIQQKYPEKFSLGLITSCGSLGLLFPPSLPLILYAIFAEVSVDQLFVAAFLPGLFLMVILGLYTTRVGITARIPRESFSFPRLLAALKGAAWELPLPFIIVGGIYGGAFTATEAAAITAFYAVVITVFVHKDLSITKDVPRVMRESMLLVGAILIILGSALGLTNYLIDEQVPQQLFVFVQSHIESRILFLIVLNLFLILVGMMMDIFSAIIVVVPLILPIASEFGIHPLHLAVIFLTNLEIGYLTPPVGLNLFLSSLRFGKSVLRVTASVGMFLLLLVCALLVITYVPELSLWLVNIMGVR